MAKRALPSSLPGDLPADALPVDRLEYYAKGWLLDSEIREHSDQTLYGRRLVTAKLLWWLRLHRHEWCGPNEVRGFLAYLTRGDDPAGRWGNAQLRGRKPKPGTTATYYNRLRTFFNHVVEEGGCTVSPMASLKPPVNRPDEIETFTQAQIDRLLSAAAQSNNPKRDTAVCYFLWDTGVRESELAGLNPEDVDLIGLRCKVHGKGKKDRFVYFGRGTKRALAAYLRESERPCGEALFVADRGANTGGRLTRTGVLRLVKRLGEDAKIEGVRCSPHTWRHTFAITFLRNGGNVFELQKLLGHESLDMVRRYVALAQVDVEAAHRRCSPVDRAHARRK